MSLKIGGRTVEGPKQGLLVLPRDDGDIVFRFIGITDDSEFEKICPAPKPPRIKDIKKGQTYDNVEDPNFKKKREEWANIKMAWYFLKSSAPSNIEWPSVNMEDSSTYQNYKKDLVEAGFTVGEVNTIYGKFIEVNMVTDDMLTEARNRFLASQEPEQSPPT